MWIDLYKPPKERKQEFLKCLEIAGYKVSKVDCAEEYIVTNTQNEIKFKVDWWGVEITVPPKKGDKESCVIKMDYMNFYVFWELMRAIRDINQEEEN